MDIKKGKMAPDGWGPEKPRDTVYKLLVADEQFWQEQVHGPPWHRLQRGQKVPQKHLQNNSHDGRGPSTECGSHGIDGDCIIDPERIEAQKGGK